MLVCWTVPSLLNLSARLDTPSSFWFCSDFLMLFAFLTSATFQNVVAQRYAVLKRSVALFDVQTVNYLELVVHKMSGKCLQYCCDSLEYFKYP